MAGDWIVLTDDFETHSTGWGGTNANHYTPARSGTVALVLNSVNAYNYSPHFDGVPTARGWLEGDYIDMVSYIRPQNLTSSLGSIGMTYGAKSTNLGIGATFRYNNSSQQYSANVTYWTTSKQNIGGGSAKAADLTYRIARVKIEPVYGGNANATRVTAWFDGTQLNSQTAPIAMPLDEAENRLGIISQEAGNSVVDDMTITVHLATDDVA